MTKVFDINTEVPRIGDRARIVAAWYLRFNGYFTVESFILQDAGQLMQTGGQLTDADIIAVRFPHTREIIKGQTKDIVVRRHARLDVQDGVTDFIIAEVSSLECKFNWIEPDCTEQTIKRDFLEYTLNRIGFWNQDRLTHVRKKLSLEKSFHDAEAKERVRLLSIGVTSDEKLPAGILPIRFSEIFEYMQKDLFSCYDLEKDGEAIKKVVSDHKQWHPLICEIYNRLRGHKTKEDNPQGVVMWLFPDAGKEQAA